LVPPPQTLLHSVHSAHSDTAQFTGHSQVLQSWVAFVAAQAIPPWAGACRIVRVWLWIPPPHVAEHEPQSFQLDNVQCTAQGSSLHGMLSITGPHSAPPKRGTTSTDRLLYLMPPPQMVVHSPHPV